MSTGYSMLTGKTYSSSNKVISFVDDIIGALRVIQDNHQLSHRGKLFSTIVSITDMSAGAKVTYSFKTPANSYVHFKTLHLSSFGASILLKLFKDATVTNEGTSPLTINNLNDNATVTSLSSVKSNPSYSGGTLWLETLVGGATSNQSATGGDLAQLAGAELILKPDTVYIIEIENISSSDTAEYVNVCLIWAELNEGITATENV